MHAATARLQMCGTDAQYTFCNLRNLPFRWPIARSTHCRADDRILLYRFFALFKCPLSLKGVSNQAFNKTGTLKNPTKCLWRWEPDRRSNFFFSPPAHLCAVTYMTEISLIVTLNNQFNSTQWIGTVTNDVVNRYNFDVFFLLLGRK